MNASPTRCDNHCPCESLEMWVEGDTVGLEAGVLGECAFLHLGGGWIKMINTRQVF